MTTHTADELAHIELTSGLQFSGWLDYEGSLMPIFLKPGRTVEERRAKILALNVRDDTASNVTECRYASQDYSRILTTVYTSRKLPRLPVQNIRAV